jgi:hypothetical protein
MVYTVPKSQASIAQNRFVFKMPGEAKQRSVPLLKFIKPSLVEALDGGEKFAVVRGLLDEYVPGVYDQFEDMEQITDFYTEWAKQSGIDMGKSSDSTDS